MARLVNGINGPIIGKVGTVTGSHRNGKGYIKANNDRKAPQTPNELVAKERFATAHHFLSPILDYVREGFRHQTKKGFNGAKSYTLLHAMEGEPMLSLVNPALVKVSLGELPLSADLAVTLKDEELIFTWNTEKPSGASLYDQLMPLAYYPDKNNAKVYGNNTSALRKSGTDSLKVNTAKGITYHIYVAFTAADRSQNSTSAYLGTIEMP
jgi:hypothetical protein